MTNHTHMRSCDCEDCSALKDMDLVMAFILHGIAGGIVLFGVVSIVKVLVQ